MEIVSSRPFSAASLLWQPRSGVFVLTVVCKAAFQLQPVESPLADHQDPVSEEDNHWNDDPSRSLYSPADLVPFKPRADVLLVGNAFAPGKEPVRSLLVRMLVGDMDKSLEVFGERIFTQDGSLREGSRFLKMALRYERAAGGPETNNPVGIRLDGPPDARGQRVLPNLQPPGMFISQVGETIPPVGFGPIAPSWPERHAKLGHHAATWSVASLSERPLPEDIDPGYFNAAPRDQQVGEIRDNERIILDNLHPEHPRLVTSLPGLRPRVVVERQGGMADLAMRADTLWIDTDRGICTVTWRGQLLLEHQAEAGHVVISPERGGENRAGTPESARNDEVGDEAFRTITPIVGQGPVMPFVPGRPEERPMAHFSRAQNELPRTMVLPQPGDVDGEEGLVELTPEDMQEISDEAPGTMTLLPHQKVSAGPALPFMAAGTPAPPMLPTVQMAPAPPPAPVAAPPAMVRAPMTVDPIAPQVRPSPWAGAEGRPGPTVGRSAGQPVASSNLMPEGTARPSAVAEGVLVASNAAAGEPPKRPEAKAPEAAPVAEARPKVKGGEVVKLIWFDPRSVARIRKHEQWRVILAELELRLLDEGEIEEEAAEGAADEPKPKDRRDIFEVLVKAQPIGPEAVKLALSEAVGEDGKFEPPLVLLSGELEFPFDELSTLKAVAAAVSPFASGDKKLKEQLDVVEELLKTPWLQGSGSIAEGLTDKLKEAFAQGKRALGPGYLESHTERMLLEQRCYQRRTVFGKKWIRSLLKGCGGAGDVPVYVPEELKDELPMFRRVRVRMIGEAEMREDQYEASACAVKVVAFGRVMPALG